MNSIARYFENSSCSKHFLPNRSLSKETQISLSCNFSCEFSSYQVKMFESNSDMAQATWYYTDYRPHYCIFQSYCLTFYSVWSILIKILWNFYIWKAHRSLRQRSSLIFGLLHLLLFPFFLASGHMYRNWCRAEFSPTKIANKYWIYQIWHIIMRGAFNADNPLLCCFIILYD